MSRRKFGNHSHPLNDSRKKDNLRTPVNGYKIHLLLVTTHHKGTKTQKVDKLNS